MKGTCGRPGDAMQRCAWLASEQNFCPPQPPPPMQAVNMRLCSGACMSICSPFLCRNWYDTLRLNPCDTASFYCISCQADGASHEAPQEIIRHQEYDPCPGGEANMIVTGYKNRSCCKKKSDSGRLAWQQETFLNHIVLRPPTREYCIIPYMHHCLRKLSLVTVKAPLPYFQP